MSDLRSRVLGTIFGTLSRGTFPKREPVAFLYNGVRLPGLPVVEGFENAYLSGTGDNIMLRLSTFEVIEDAGTIQANETGEMLTYTVDGGKWVHRRTDSIAFWDVIDVVVTSADVWFWTAKDILSIDNSVYLAASKPVPVYE